jgi:hypothetical protein
MHYRFEWDSAKARANVVKHSVTFDEAESVKNKPTKNASEILDDDDPLDHEIDFSKSRPNPYWLGMVDRRCVRLLASDLADAFPDDAAVNDVLRSLLRTNVVNF